MTYERAEGGLDLNRPQPIMLKILPIMLLSSARAYYAQNYALKIKIMLENRLFY